MEVAYQKLYNILRDDILNGRLKDGEKIPAERILCEKYGISRITVRQSLKLLQDQGFVSRQPGKGTFVQRIKTGKMPILDMNSEKSLVNVIPNLKRKILIYENIIPPQDIQEELQLLKSETCLFMQRIDYKDDEVLCFDCAYIPNQYTDSINEEIAADISFFSVWKQKENIPISYIKCITEASLAAKEDIEILKVKAGSPMIINTDQIYSVDSQVLGIFITHYPGEKFKFISRERFHEKNFKINVQKK